MDESFRVGTAEASRGTTVWGEIPIPPDYVGRLDPPRVAVVHGADDGPILYVGAGAHGDEYNAIEAVRRAAIALDPVRLRGTVIFVPTQNSAAFAARARHTPSDGGDIDFCYPGRLNGSPTEVLARLLLEQAVTRADYGLDLHTATRNGWNLVHALCAPEPVDAGRAAQALARAFGARVVVALDPPVGGHLGERSGWNLDHNLFAQATLRGVPTPIIEFGEGGRLEPDQVELGLRGIHGVLAHLGMIEPGSGMPSAEEPHVARESVAIQARSGGFLYVDVEPGQRVRRGDRVARVVGFPDAVEDVASTEDGVVVRVTTEGKVEPGERVVVVAAG